MLYLVICHKNISFAVFAASSVLFSQLTVIAMRKEWES
jgi:hypothetical protein